MQSCEMQAYKMQAFEVHVHERDTPRDARAHELRTPCEMHAPTRYTPMRYT